MKWGQNAGEQSPRLVAKAIRHLVAHWIEYPALEAVYNISLFKIGTAVQGFLQKILAAFVQQKCYKASFHLHALPDLPEKP